MSFLDLVKKRQSCRKYLPASVPCDVLERCLEAARLSPSACNSQAWRFIVVAEPSLRARLAEKAFAGVYAMNGFAKEAPVLVVVVTERSKYVAQVAGATRGTQYNLIDIGIACEHFILQATEEGLGTCWIGWFDQKGVREVLGLSKHDCLDIVISVGYPADAQREKVRKTTGEMSEIR
ncbi:MAG TPA: nitroreductase family protein [Candidatus Omnitrophota bacterium]|nr:nitroreductase family protein [Candidatus Omnitrophota bacterium]HQL40951.1 nitroreductase family protein [Candidatus Omnitrophota bacterium]